MSDETNNTAAQPVAAEVKTGCRWWKIAGVGVAGVALGASVTALFMGNDAAVETATAALSALRS